MSESLDNAECALWLLKYIEIAVPLEDGFRSPIFALGKPVEQAVMIAAAAHRDQYRATFTTDSVPYIEHIANVSAMVCRNVKLVAGEIDPEDLICAAILHDAYEDFADVRVAAREAFSERTVELLEAQRKVSSRDVTERRDRDMILAKKIEKFGPPAILVKLCDLTDNVHSSRKAPAHLRDRLLDRVRNLYLPLAFRHDKFYYLAKRLEAAAHQAAAHRTIGESQMDYAERALSVVGQRAHDWHDFFENLSYAAGFSRYEIVAEKEISKFCRRYGLSTLDIDIRTPNRSAAVAVQKIAVKSGWLLKKDQVAVLIKSVVVNRYIEEGNVLLAGFVDPHSQDNILTPSTIALLIDYIDLKMQF